MEIDKSNLSSSDIVIVPSNGVIHLQFTVYFQRVLGPANLSINFIIGSYNTSTGQQHKAAGPFSISDADFKDSNTTFGMKSFAIDINNSDLTYNNVVLIYDPFGYTNFSVRADRLYNTPANSSPPVIYNPPSNVHPTVKFINARRDPDDFFYSAYGVNPAMIYVSHTPILTANQAIYSENGAYKLILQGDGNLVIYRTSDNYTMWSTDTNGSGAQYLYFQDDANLVLTKTTDLHSSVWSSNIYTVSQPNQSLATNSKYVLQNDGNLVMLIDYYYYYYYQFSPPSRPGIEYLVLGSTGSSNDRSIHYGIIN
ncbi:hypothetical protein [Mucilaginibacter paludis]|nr:hypothetical protein [Mucilaginibacter paludis]